MNISEIIRTRRSIYPEQFLDKSIEEKDLITMLENANFAPTHKLTQPWRFKIISGDKKTALGLILADWMKANNSPEKFSEMQYQKMLSRPQKSAVVVAICMQRDPKESLPEWEELAATAMAVQNIWLTGASLGIGMYWATPKPIKSKEIGNFLKLTEGESCLGFLYMGYSEPNPEQKANRTAIEDKIVRL
jgi:nitroreductase